MLVSRSSLEKPRPFERLVRTSSPSRISTRWPRLRSSSATRLASVDLPAPERPVNQRVKPSLMRGIVAPDRLLGWSHKLYKFHAGRNQSLRNAENQVDPERPILTLTRSHFTRLSKAKLLV